MVANCLEQPYPAKQSLDMWTSALTISQSAWPLLRILGAEDHIFGEDQDHGRLILTPSWKT